MHNPWFEHLKKDYVRGFPGYCGFEVTHVNAGIFETRLHPRPEHLQQDGFVHAGVMATMADHTAGYAAFTLVDASFRILTIEFKINFFKPAVGDAIVCQSRVIQEGRTIIVSESDIFACTGSDHRQVAKAMVTLMAVALKK